MSSCKKLTFEEIILAGEPLGRGLVIHKDSRLLFLRLDTWSIEDSTEIDRSQLVQGSYMTEEGIHCQTFSIRLPCRSNPASVQAGHKIC